MPHSTEMITVDGTTIRLLRGGSGTPVVFLHGAGGHTGWILLEPHSLHGTPPSLPSPFSGLAFSGQY